VPAYFDDGARAATKHAAHLAGLHVLRLINEPTAAALAYGLDKQAEGKYVIYDLGGGTFDVSVLNMQKGVFQVLATGGDVNLGGDDIDYLLVDLFKKKLTKNYQLTIQDLSLLYGYARKIKESFSNKTEVEVNFNIASEAINFKLSYQEFESLILPTIERTLTIVRNVMHDGKIKTNQIKGVVLVGGSTRVKLIKTQLDEFFQTNCLVDINPDEVVALGAAIQAESLTKGSDNLLIDVTPLSLGLEIMGGLNEKVIDRNTPLPISVTKEFTTYQDGQTAMWFHIVQGERDLVKDCRSLARFELRNIPAMKAGIARIIVNFTIDADGMLTVSAEEMTTASKQIIDIKPSYGLSPDQIETMLIDAMNNVDIDVTQRLLIESKVNAMGVINILDKATKEDPELLSNTEFKNIENQIQLLQQYIDQNNRDQIEKHLQQLENLIKDFSDRKMNKYIKLALRGKNITEIDN
jgi:molecular chaperone HscA